MTDDQVDGRRRWQSSLHANIKVRMPAGRFPEEQFPVRDEEHPDASCCSARAATATARCSSRPRSAGSSSTRRSRPTSRSTTRARSRSATSPSSSASWWRCTRGPWWPRASTSSRTSASSTSTRSGLTISIADVKTPDGEGRSAREVRGRGREGRGPVRPRRHHRRRASPEGDRDLERGHRTRP